MALQICKGPHNDQQLNLLHLCLQNSSDRMSGEPLAEWTFILREGLEEANKALAEMIPGSGGLKALHLKNADHPYFLRLSREQTRDLQARVGADPVTHKAYVQVWSHMPCSKHSASNF